MYITKKSVRKTRYQLPTMEAVTELSPAYTLAEAIGNFFIWVGEGEPYFEHDSDNDACDIFYNGDCYTIERN